MNNNSYHELSTQPLLKNETYKLMSVSVKSNKEYVTFDISLIHENKKQRLGRLNNDQ